MTEREREKDRDISFGTAIRWENGKEEKGDLKKFCPALLTKCFLRDKSNTLNYFSNDCYN